jgi:DNA-binding transcriptional LysR family regulator
MIDLQHVMAFRAIVQFGTFSAAAHALSLTQPAISVRIRELERALGVKLFNTRSRKPILTEKGQYFISHADHLLAVVRAIEEDMVGTQSIAGRLRLGVTETVELTWLKKLVESVKESLPNVVLELIVELTGDLWEELHEGSVDMILVPEPLSGTGLSFQDLGRTDYVWAASPKMKIPTRRLSAKDIAAYPIVTLTSASALSPVTERWFQESQVRPNLTSQCSTMRLAFSLANAGLGIILVPRPILKSEGPDLVELDVHPRYPELTFFAVYLEALQSRACRETARLARLVSTFMK